MVPAASLTSAGPLRLTVGAPLVSVMLPTPSAGVLCAGVCACSVKVSVGSLVPSLIVGTRTTTWSSGVFAGTVIVAVPSGPTVTGSKVLPPSKLTFGAPVSSPGVAGVVWPGGAPSLGLATVGGGLALGSL